MSWVWNNLIVFSFGILLGSSLCVKCVNWFKFKFDFKLELIIVCSLSVLVFLIKVFIWYIELIRVGLMIMVLIFNRFFKVKFVLWIVFCKVLFYVIVILVLIENVMFLFGDWYGFFKNVIWLCKDGVMYWVNLSVLVGVYVWLVFKCSVKFGIDFKNRLMSMLFWIGLYSLILILVIFCFGKLFNTGSSLLGLFVYSGVI